MTHSNEIVNRRVCNSHAHTHTHATTLAAKWPNWNKCWIFASISSNQTTTTTRTRNAEKLTVSRAHVCVCSMLFRKEKLKTQNDISSSFLLPVYLPSICSVAHPHIPLTCNHPRQTNINHFFLWLSFSKLPCSGAATAEAFVHFEQRRPRIVIMALSGERASCTLAACDLKTKRFIFSNFKRSVHIEGQF